MFLSKRNLLLNLLILGCSCSEPTKLGAELTEQKKPVNVFKEPAVNYWQPASVLYRLTEIANNYNVSSSDSSPTDLCLKELKEIQQSILRKKPWALKVLDASASKPSGFLFQHNYWLGNPSVCGTANDRIVVTLQKYAQPSIKAVHMDDLAPFKMAFRVVYVQHSSAMQVQLTYSTDSILHLGLCLPASCTQSDIHRLSVELMMQKTDEEVDLYGMESNVLYVKDLELKEEFFARRSLKIIIAALVFTVVMICWASLLKQSSLKPDKANHETSVHKGFAESRMHDIVKSFDIVENCHRLFTIAPYSKRDIPIINGLRSLLSLVVLTAHVCWFQRNMINNEPLFIASMKKESLRITQFGFLTVDAFFTISGFLHVFSFLRNTELMETIRQNKFLGNVKLFFSMLFYRYIRLVPLYAIAMGLADLISAYLNDVSLFHVYERHDQNCAKNWWHNLLFIQNHFPAADMCLLWSWSLSCEMHFFVWTSVPIFIYAKQPKFVRRGFLTLLATNIAWTVFKGVSNKYQQCVAVILETINEVYINPSVRVLAYMIGNIAAWYYVTQLHTHNLRPWIEKVVWNFALLLVVVCACTTTEIDSDYFLSISQYTLKRCMLSLAICCMIICSATGSSSWWSHFLEAQLFRHINRMTFSIYLINPLIVMLLSGLMDTSLRISLTLMIALTFGYILITYVLSIGFTLAFEMPYCNLSRIILKNKKQKKL